jgi:hypothetical protein
LRSDWLVDVRSRVTAGEAERITRYPHEQPALFESKLPVFAIGNQHLLGPVMADYFVASIKGIVLRSRKPGPFVDVVHPAVVERDGRGREREPVNQSDTPSPEEPAAVSSGSGSRRRDWYTLILKLFITLCYVSSFGHDGVASCRS